MCKENPSFHPNSIIIQSEYLLDRSPVEYG